MKKFLIVGLGNIGEKYENTRHNIGFKIVEEIGKNFQEPWESVSFGMMKKTSYKGRKTYVLKPDTYMNLSGKAVKYWKEKLEINTENILIITDDLHLDFGVLRLKTKGSSAGHNGLKSIEDLLQTQQYCRLRFGIGNEFSKGQQVDYVLGEWSKEENKSLPERIEKMNEAVKNFVCIGLERTMNFFNGK